MSISGQIVCEILAQLCTDNSIQIPQNFFGLTPKKISKGLYGIADHKYHDETMQQRIVLERTLHYWITKHRVAYLNGLGYVHTVQYSFLCLDYKHLSNIWLSTLEISAWHLCSITEIVPKSLFLRVHSSPIQYGFGARAKTIW